MRTLAICLLALATLGLASDGSGRRVTVVHDLVVARVIKASQHPSPEPVRPHVKRPHQRHAAVERPSLLARFGRAIGITVHHR